MDGEQRQTTSYLDPSTGRLIAYPQIDRQLSSDIELLNREDPYIAQLRGVFSQSVRLIRDPESYIDHTQFVIDGRGLPISPDPKRLLTLPSELAGSLGSKIDFSTRVAIDRVTGALAIVYEDNGMAESDRMIAGNEYDIKIIPDYKKIPDSLLSQVAPQNKDNPNIPNPISRPLSKYPGFTLLREAASNNLILLGLRMKQQARTLLKKGKFDSYIFEQLTLLGEEELFAKGRDPMSLPLFERDLANLRYWNVEYVANLLS